MTWWLLLIPLASALSSWLVIKLFFLILFRPVKPMAFLGIRIQGILPSKQASIAAQAGKLVANDFFSIRTIEEKITDPAQVQRIMPVIEEHIDDFLRNKLKKEMPVVGVFIGDKTIASLKAVFMKELQSLFPKIISGFVSNVIKDLDIEQLVATRLNAVSVMDMEVSLRKRFSKELRLAAFFAALVGLLVGLLTLLAVFCLK